MSIRFLAEVQRLVGSKDVLHTAKVDSRSVNDPCSWKTISSVCELCLQSFLPFSAKSLQRMGTHASLQAWHLST